MSVMRSALLAGSQSVWLRERAMRWGFVRRSVSRFMPGERVEDALAAAASLQQRGMASMLTKLGENLTGVADAAEIRNHYLDVLDRVSAAGLSAQISVKLTQLGLDLDQGLCLRNLESLIDHAGERDNFVWIDMEGSTYVDRTLELYRRARQRSTRVGIALQAYLYRTESDIVTLLPFNPAIRLVKGAYLEPPAVAYPRKADVDERYFALACRLLSHSMRDRAVRVQIATHDRLLIDRVGAFISGQDISHECYEYAMLYGIQRSLQQHLVQSGHRLRVLISYGEQWFPWYMRRLAERPANVWFVVRNFIGG